MQRSIDDLANREFDVLVVGGGAAGAAAAREAGLRGYRAALIERDDFGSGASAHCFKVVHGGIRYLQHADVARLRASCRERAVLLRIAPHLVSPLPFAVPTYGRGRSSKGFLCAGMLVYDALTADCNARIADPARRIRRTRLLDRAETLRLFPMLETRGLTGAAVFEDGQMHSPPRLVLAFVKAAEALGATVANYVEAERLIMDGSRVRGVVAVDRLEGGRFDIRARMVVNAAGPWAESLLQSLAPRPAPTGRYSRDACFVVARRPTVHMALALQGRTRDADALLARGARHLFLVPWRTCLLAGVWHKVVPRDPDGIELTREELREFIAEINACHPALQLKEGEVRLADYGLVPFGETARERSTALSFGKESRLIDHAAHSGVAGLVTLISVRYTVARRDAAMALDRVDAQLGTHRSAPGSALAALPGGAIERFEDFARELARRSPEWLPPLASEALARHYGTEAAQVLALAQREPQLRRCCGHTEVTHAEIAYAVREELARCMADVVFRRTALGTAGHPGAAALDEVQALLRRECGWSTRRAADERDATERHFDRYLAAAEPQPLTAGST